MRLRTPLLAALALALSDCAGEAETAPAKPDILFIAIDDLNDWDGAMGGPIQAKIPNIDALAARGMLFTNAHAVGTSCTPSRTARSWGGGNQPAGSTICRSPRPTPRWATAKWSNGSPISAPRRQTARGLSPPASIAPICMVHA
ncbi:MAG: sulfatase-like hydrolase/transferase [Erythrobacter sp.]|nr:sulfatase-like hydrolase/transferase [Erythrobacter sp.]